jgi:hypothetical protein
LSRSRIHDQVNEFASWPLWKKCLAIAGVIVGAIAVVLAPLVTGRLTLGWESVGLVLTIIPSQEPLLFVAALAVVEALFAFMLYGLIKVFFFPKSITGD